jgi:hypothetical protein
MKYALVLTGTLFFTACNNSSGPAKEVVKDSSATYIHRFTDTSLENRITHELMKLPFVIKSNEHIDSLSNHRHGISFMMDAPNVDESVQAGYNGGERFETYYRFLVNPKTMEIKVYDPVEDKVLSLKEYIKTQQ